METNRLWNWRLTVTKTNQITADGDCSHEIKRRLLLEREVMTNLDSILKSRGPSSQGYGFSSGHVWVWELDCEESWALTNWCFWTVVLEKTLESPLDCKEIQTVHSKGDQSWVFFGRNDAEAETPILWPSDVKNWLIWKAPDAGKDWGQEEKGTTEDEMVGWHHWHNGHGFGWTPGVGDGQGGLVCCSSWGRKESDTTERLNWTENKMTVLRPLTTNFKTTELTVLCLHVPHPLSIKALAPDCQGWGVGAVSPWTGVCPPPPPLLASKIQQTFHQ